MLLSLWSIETRYQEDWRRNEIPERPRSKVIISQSRQICKITKYF